MACSVVLMNTNFFIFLIIVLFFVCALFLLPLCSVVRIPRIFFCFGLRVSLVSETLFLSGFLLSSLQFFPHSRGGALYAVLVSSMLFLPSVFLSSLRSVVLHLNVHVFCICSRFCEFFAISLRCTLLPRYLSYKFSGFPIRRALFLALLKTLFMNFSRHSFLTDVALKVLNQNQKQNPTTMLTNEVFV
jgi:hypothetical protein